jgi:hypothetical protein
MNKANNAEPETPPFKLRGWAMCKQLATLGEIAELIDCCLGLDPLRPCKAMEAEVVRDAIFERMHGALYDSLKVLAWLKGADAEGRFSDPGKRDVWNPEQAHDVLTGGSAALRKILDDYGIEQSARPTNLKR